MTPFSLNDELYQAVHSVAHFAAPHVNLPRQTETRDEVMALLASGQHEQLPDALWAMGLAFLDSVTGGKVDMKDAWVTARAYELRRRIEAEIVAVGREEAAA
jgi:hypothetical protein